jgi:hypothetical protein
MELTDEQLEEIKSLPLGRKAVFINFLDTIDALKASLTEAHAESAAVLEKAAKLVGPEDSNFGSYHCRDKVLALIPLPAAAALAEVKRKERLETIEKACRAVKPLEDDNDEIELAIRSVAPTSQTIASTDKIQLARLDEAEWWYGFCNAAGNTGADARLVQIRAERGDKQT